MKAPAVLNAAELRGLLAQPSPPRVIDVRTPGEFETVHIAGSYNVPLDLLREHRDEIRSHLDEHVVLVCQSGQRATQAEDSLGHIHDRMPLILDGEAMGEWLGPSPMPDLDLAMAAHASQSSPYVGLPGGLADDFLDTARARRVVPPWTGGPRESELLA